MEAMLGDSVYEIVAYAIVGFSGAFLLLVVACCELELAINRRDEIALEELAMPDVRAALWYTVSGLFGLYALVMAVLLPDAGAFSYILSSIDLALSLGLLIYYLNKVKEPSPGYRVPPCGESGDRRADGVFHRTGYPYGDWIKTDNGGESLDPVFQKALS